MDLSLGRIGNSPPPLWRSGDPSMVALPLLTAVLGALSVYSTTKGSGDLAITSFFERQVMFSIIGFALMMGLAAFDYRRVSELSLPAFGLVVVVLFAVLQFGAERNNSQAWFEFGSFQFQPSEFAKVGVVLAVAGQLAPHAGAVSGKILAGALAMVSVPLYLILQQPDLGTAMVIVTAAAGMLIVAGVRWRQIAALAILALAAASLIVGTGQLEEFQRDRLEVFFSPGRAGDDAQWNAKQAKIAVSAGGMTGQGWGNGTQTQLDFVPEQHTDFIFTAVAEELGFIGAGTLLLIYLVICLRLIRIAQLSTDPFGTLLVSGVVTMLVFQVFQNAGMSMGVMPITGIPLPLMSYGGSSTLAWFAMFGLAQSVHLRRGT